MKLPQTYGAYLGFGECRGEKAKTQAMAMVHTIMWAPTNPWGI